MVRTGVSGTSILDKIIASKEHEVTRLKSIRNKLLQSATNAPPTRPVLERIAGNPNVAVIAEVKRKSPGAGLIDMGIDPVGLSGEYESGGASAISVLTDGPWFGGALSDLEDVSRARRIPVLRKDFVVDEVQLWESRAAGADAVLLIARILEQALLEDLLAAACGIGVTALAEVHDETELEAALKAGARLVGINNRDLSVFRTSLEVTERLAPLVPDGVAVVSESGIGSAEDVARAAAAGADAVLVGEALVRSGNPRGLVAKMAAVPRSARAA